MPARYVRRVPATGHLFARRTRPGLLLGFLAFAAVGLSNTVYGPSFERFATKHAVGLGSVGLLVSVQFAGAVIAIALTGLVLERFGYRAVIATGGAVLAAFALGVAHAPTWPLTLVAAGLGGLGTGALVGSVNLLTARLFEPAASPALNLMNAVYGLGAISGPLLVALSTPRLEPPFYLLAVLGLAVAAATSRVSAPVVRRPPASVGRAPIGAVVAFALVLFFYIATEVGITSWETEHLSGHFGPARAAAYTSLYWVAVTCGRLLAVPLSTRLAPGVIVTGAMGLGALSVFAAQAVALAPLFYALAGLAIAPVFATTVAWFTATFGERSERYAPAMLAGGNLGVVTTAPAIGAAVAVGGPELIPSLLAGLAAIGFGVAGLLLLRQRSAR